MHRRGFLGFFLLGGLAGLLDKKVRKLTGTKRPEGLKEARFWSRAEEEPHVG